MQVLVVEDEVRLADALTEILKAQQYLMDTVYDGQDGYAYGRSGQYDVIVLDVMLPKKDGFRVARDLRNEGVDTPILMLTARDELQSKVSGLDSGADDYMTKPFAPEELLARIRAMTRRKGEVMLHELKFEDLTLGLDTRVLSCGAKSVNLGFKEFEVLKLLMASPNQIIEKESLISRVWGAFSGAEDNNVEAYISFLRKKFFFLGSAVGISSIRKVGYRMEKGQ